jgi:hypothetical protein
LAQVADRQLEEETIELFREIELMRVQAIRRIDEIDGRRSYEGEGYLSTTSWLRDKCRLTAKEARGLVGAARALRSMPATRRALAARNLTYPAVQMPGIARDAHPEAFGRDETMLVEQAGVLSPGGLRQALGYWRQAADEDSGVAAAERRHRRRRLFIAQTLDGMVRLDGDLDPEGGAIVIAAVSALSEPGGLDPLDDRSGPQRRADALVELCRADLDNGAAPVSGGEKPHVSVIVDLQTLQGRQPRSASWKTER